MSKSTSATQKRTRTGCRTCRQRKLKCDEDRPICGQCRKSNRECIASEGVTFRHAQNAGFTDGDGSEKDLANFYKYRQKFDQTNYFLPIPRELTFVEVTDPYAEDFSLPSSSHGLRYTNFTTPALPTLASSDPPQYADVAASSLKAMIDPQLEQMLGLTESIMDGKLTETATDLTFTATTAAEQEAQDRFQETIVQALRESEEQVKDEAVV